MRSIVTTFRGAVIKVEVANFCAAMDTLIDQDVQPHDSPVRGIKVTEPDLNSPWEHPRSGSYSTPALESPVGFLLY